MIDLTDLRWRAGEQRQLVPDLEDVRAIEEPLLTQGPRCPAAQLGKFADTGRVYVRCGVERKVFAVSDSPAAAINWCCGDYDGGSILGPCPVWVAEQEADPALARTYAAQEKVAADALTHRQIAAGVRVDDRGLDPSLPSGTREVIEAIEEIGEQNG